jgi:hypothetical protein
MHKKSNHTQLAATALFLSTVIWGCARGMDARTAPTTSPPPPEAPAPVDPTSPVPQPMKPPANLAECYAQHLLSVARQHVKSKYKNRSHSRGQCAQAVREDLNLADIDQGSYGDAINYYKRPKGQPGALELMGFKNDFTDYPSADKAPAGAVLVYRGPLTDDYLKNGSYPPKGKRHGHAVGDWVGHITVKGDFKHGDSWYYTDGRTARPAIARRTLVGVFMMVHCKNCSAELKKQCGDTP